MTVFKDLQKRISTRWLVVVIVLALGTSLPVAAASAETPGPGWELTATDYPTNLPPEGNGLIVIDVLNVGAASSNGTVTVTDTLPPGVTAGESGELISAATDEIGHELWQCAGTTVVTCTNSPTNMRSLIGGGGNPTLGGVEGPNLDPQIGIAVHVGAKEVTEAEAKADPNRVTITGGGAPSSASTTDPVPVSSSPAARFGFVGLDGWASNADGTLDTQAGSHPYEFTASLDLATVLRNGTPQSAGSEFRNVEAKLPPGFVGDPTVVPQCTLQQLNGLNDATGEGCPAASQIGIQTITWGGGAKFRERLFNMVPPPGVAAEFGSTDNGIKTFYDSTVRSGGDYGITVHIDNIAQRNIVSVVDTFWGVPGDRSHDPWRSEQIGGCSTVKIEHGECSLGSIRASKPFLTLPTACGQPQTFTISANTWSDPAVKAEDSFQSHDSNGGAVGYTGCEHLGFAPTITTAPDTASADTPAGLTVEVKPPLGGLEDPEGVATSDIQNTTVTLPQGLVINPGQAAGLQACQPSQDGLTTEAEKAEGKENDGPPSCPNASKVGTVVIKSPLIEGTAEKQFEGNVYVLQSNPPELKLLVAASADGVNLKLVGVVHLNEQTGQLTTTFEGTPELPFTVFKLSFSGGAQAALDTPTQCGSYTTSADFNPWSSPFVSDFNTNAVFGISAGPSGSPCPANPMPFAPTLTAGSTTDQAGAFTNFSLLLQRGDAQQRIEKLQFKEPAGLAGLISSVPLCDEANANAGTCPASSHIGHAVVTSGPGPYPLVLPQPGAPELPIFLTGPYKGAPFGLSIVTPVIAGPFNLGTVITRAKIEIDPLTAQITITTDPLPQIVDGVPTDLRSVNSIIDRPNFLFNPTNCESQSFTGTAWGTAPPGASEPGETAPLSSHFGVGSCRELGFHPTVAVTTAARSSKANGASLNFKIAYPKDSVGSQSWMKEMMFVIPKQLPSRLTTLQKACLASTFETDRAACPAASIIGHVLVHTPVLPVPLEGPLYFVSYGGAAFPDAVAVLHGYGVTIESHGHTLISHGVTSATFDSVPDVPFESIEVTVPQGPFSEFGANLPHGSYDFCGQKLVMPILFKAQNGLEIHQNTAIGVTGCPKAKATRAQKLATALKACKKKPKAKRARCAREARKKYGPVKKKKKK